MIQKKLPHHFIPVICGPTASGKTHLAVAVAKRLIKNEIEPTIISADSRQVYRRMDIGTGKDLAEYHFNGKTIPTACLDIADPSEIFTLYDYQKNCYHAIKEIRKKASQPLICGGTGLYIEAVLNHYQIPNIPENIEYRKKKMEEPKEKLQEELRVCDADLYSQTDLNSKKRVVRALEIAEAKKRGTLQYGSDNGVEISPLILITEWEKKELNRRIDLRLAERIGEGMIEEVEALIKEGITLQRLKLFGMEYSQIGQYLFGKKTKQSALEDLAIAIHRLAKRQMTWFRGMEKRGFEVFWIQQADEEKAWSVIERSFLN